jgi:signal transduction histidine kinase
MKAGPALRVAVVTALLVACVYVIGAVAIFFVTSARLASKTDSRLGELLTDVRRDPHAAVRDYRLHQEGDDQDESPAYLWIVGQRPSGGRMVTARSSAAPPLPGTVLDNLPAPGIPATASLGHDGSYRLLTMRSTAGELVVGISRAGDLHTEHLLLDAELVAGPAFVVVMFCGSLVVGMRALAPVEHARQRQLEFTADASHELRTPLSVLRAEVDVALSSRRTAGAYRDSLVRIQSESDRLRRLVDDLLWLARFDSRPPSPGNEPVDVSTLAMSCADRFRAVGPKVIVDAGAAPGLINAPPEWIDRLMGVLMDNACRYAGPDGQVRISVRATGGHVALTVEDSGPGIPEEQRSRLFGRFQRATADGDGTGLGLAIGDSIVRSTGGRWHVGASPLGGALLEVFWRHHRRLPGRPS